MRSTPLLLALVVPAVALAATTKKPAAKAKATPAAAAAATPDPARQAAFTAKVAEAKADADKDDLMGARNAWRTAVTLAQSDADKKTATDGYAGVEKDCLDDAKHEISEAKAYLSDDNPAEAAKAIDKALQYADQDSDKERQQALELKKQLHRDNER